MNIKSRLAQETVLQVPSSPPCCVPRTTTAREVIVLLKDYSHSGVLICDDGVLAGVYTERDALKTMTRGIDLGDPIGELMTSRPTTLQTASTIGEALRKMASGGFRRLPIVDDAGCPIAVVDMPALVYYLDQYFPSAVYNLPPKQMLCTPERDGA